MTKVRYFFRKPGLNFSIERVFDAILQSQNLINQSDKVCVKFHRASLLHVLFNLFYVYTNRIQGINHVTGDIHYVVFALKRSNTVLTIHDMSSYHSSRGLKRFLIWLIWFYLPCIWVKNITCISEKTKQELIKYAKCNAQKISVIYNPVFDNFVYTEREFNKIKPRILHIGTRKNKNLERVVVALKDIECHLRIVGELSDKQQYLLKSNNLDYSSVCDIEDKEMLSEYIDSDIISFPSLYEGFGMPVVEGQAIGRPVLSSNIGPINEISCDKCALLVNPLSTEEISVGFKRIIEDSGLRETLVKQGIINVTRFRLNKVAGDYLLNYNSLKLS